MRAPRQALLRSRVFMLIALTSSCAMPYPQPSQTLLEITIKSDGTNVSATYILECSDGSVVPTSTLPMPSVACDELEDHPNVLTPSLDPATPCTEIYGGPQRAEISGTFNGQPIDSEFSRSNGCLISQWDDAEFLFGS